MPRPAGPLLLVVGRLRGITRARLAELAPLLGVRLGRGAEGRAGLVVMAESACTRALTGLLDEPLARLRGTGAELVGEAEFRRRAGLDPPLEPSPDALTLDALRALSGLDEATLEWLCLFDLVQGAGPAGERRFRFRDVVVAREVRRLMAGGADLAQVVAGALRLRQLTGARLSEVRLEDAIHLTRSWADGILELTGQYRLDLDDPAPALPEVVERAEWAEAAGYLQAAERDWRLALRLDPADPVPPFNLGNVLHEVGRTAEAALAWRQALARDRGFAEAWYNLARLAEDQGRTALAAARYRAALALRPAYADAVYNYALLLQRSEELAPALRFWNRYTVLAPADGWIEQARSNAVLCRMGLVAARRGG
jgi:tetratricopeptide (TPR) repeat protein